MFFYFSKIFSLIFFPLPFFLFILLLFFIVKKYRILFFITFLFGILSTEFTASKLLQILEDQYPIKNLNTAEKMDAAIVLGGLSNPLRMVSDFPEFTDGVERILIAEKLYQLKKIDFIIISGATGYLRQSILPESIPLKNYLSITIPENKILIEKISRNTYENAIQSIELCKEYKFRKIYLITSAFHMFRAYSIFQKVIKDNNLQSTIEIIPYPVDYRSLRQIAGIEDFFPNDIALRKSTIAIKEIIGIIAYKIKGYL